MTLTVDRLTTGEISGTGVFDVLMRATEAHIESQYADRRILAADFGEVYLGAISAVMAQSVQFLISSQQSDLIAAQTALANKQVEVAEAQLVNLTKEGVNIDAKTALVNAQVTKINAEIPLVAKQGLKLDADIALSTAQGVSITKSLDKTDQEIALLLQRRATEEAQTLDTANNGVPVAGVLGKQKVLYTAQTNGFARKAELDVGKLHADLWTIMRTTDSAFPLPTSIQDAAMNSVLNKVHAGIGA